MSLIAFFLYMCAAMTAMPLPVDPVIVGMGGRFNPLTIALVGTLGTLAASLIEYAMIHTIVRKARLERKLFGSKVYRRFKRFAKRRMFTALVVFAATPLPFDPIRIFAALSRYSIPRFVAAIAIGRAPRYFLLAFVGEMIYFPAWAIIALCVLFTLYGAVGMADKQFTGSIWRTTLLTPIWPKKAASAS